MEPLSDRWIEREQRADDINRDGLSRRVMGLGMKEQAMPEVVRIFRLITTAPGGFGNDEIRRMVNGKRVGFGPDAFGNDVVTIVGIAPSADGRAPAVAHFADEGWRSAQFHHFNSVRTYREQGENSANRMCDERFKVMDSQGLVIAIDFGVFVAISIQTGGQHFIQHDPRKFRTTADDGRIRRDLLQVSEQLGYGIDNIRTRSRRL